VTEAETHGEDYGLRKVLISCLIMPLISFQKKTPPVFPQPILIILNNNQKVWLNGNPSGGWISRRCPSNRLHRFARLAPHSRCQLSPSHRERPTSLITRVPDASRVVSIATAEGNRIAMAGVTILQHAVWAPIGSISERSIIALIYR
jgi:hypothetical protein